LVAHATATATRPVPESPVHTVLAWEIRSSTEWGTRPFAPHWFQPLTPDAVDLKAQALAVYDSELRPWPHTRSRLALDAQAQVRGAQIGHENAEAFELVRHIS
jgi:hypothetical protein